MFLPRLPVVGVGVRSCLKMDSGISSSFFLLMLTLCVCGGGGRAGIALRKKTPGWDERLWLDDALHGGSLRVP